jgi:N6-adenosine-specific RNA methylase IME4
MDLPKKYFRAILADPPWRFKSYTSLDDENWDIRRDVEKHYGTMSPDDIMGLPIAGLTHPEGCHLFLWTTGPFLETSFDVIKAWGFKYSAIAFCWVKMRRGKERLYFPLEESDLHLALGHTTRHNVELVLLGRRGNPKRLAKDVREVILSPVREHSRKPQETHKRIERYCDGPYLELFAREQRPGWSTWGNETEKFSNRSVARSESAVRGIRPRVNSGLRKGQQDHSAVNARLRKKRRRLAAK